MRSSLEAALIAPFVALGLGAFAFGCSLTNVSRSDCTSDGDCAAAFGAGSKCSAGFCSDPSGCTTGHDCRRIQGGGACVEGKCVSSIPMDAQCNSMEQPPEPPDLLSQPLVGPDAPLVIGSIYALDNERERALTNAVRLAVREINKDGLSNGQKLGVIFCDNGGPGDTIKGDQRMPLDQHALDYLAGTLGAPYIVGPLTSADAIILVNHLKKQAYPTVIISASATSPSLTTLDDRPSATDPHGLFWRTCPSDQIQGQVLAKDALPLAAVNTGLTINRATVIYVQDAYGNGLSQAFQTDFGIDRVDLLPYDEKILTDPDKTALNALADAADKNVGEAVVLIGHDGSSARAILAAMEGKSVINRQFFFTDGLKAKSTLLAQPMTPAVQSVLKNALGTAPASPSGTVYSFFATNLQAAFPELQAGDYSYLAQAYDATYLGAFGVVYASRSGMTFDGRGVAEGLSRLSAGQDVQLTGIGAFSAGKGSLVQDGQINVEGASGQLQFDPKTGEAPGPIEIWGINGTFTDFTTVKITSP